MKRRDFLAATAGLASSMLPLALRGESKPCPPGLLSVGGEATVETTCAAPGVAPAWFLNQADRTWVAVAASPGQRLIDAYHGVPLGFGSSFATMAQAWSGGCVDQSRGELLFAANGGHADYAGNEVYACAIRSDDPQWYRLSDPSPAEMITPIMSAKASSTANTPEGQGFVPNGYAAMFLDGRMRAVHGWHSAQFSNGKIWYPTQSSPSGVGYSTGHAWSFNRNGSGIPTAPGGRALAWAKNAGPWTWLGYSDGGSGGLGVAPPSALDAVSGLIWTVEGNACRKWAALNTRTNDVTGSSDYPYSNNTGSNGMWAAVVYDPSGQDRWRFFVVPAQYRKGLHILNLKAADPYVTAAWSVVPVTDETVLTATKGCGAVYHRSSMSILLGNPKSLRGNVMKIRVPTKADGTYDGSAPWSVSTVQPAAGSSDPSAGINANHNGAWSKFNIIEDMGNSQSALVVCMEVNAPTYVYKLPVQGV